MSRMRTAELYVTWILLALTSVLSAVACWGVWRLHAALQAFRAQMFGYRDNLD